MNCQEIKKLIPLFLEDGLDASEVQLVRGHLSTCLDCQKEKELYERSWDVLEKWEDIELTPGFVSRFWTELSVRTPWHEKVMVACKESLSSKRFAPALVTLSIVIIVGILSFRNYSFNVQETNNLLATLSPEEVEMVEHMELAQNFEIIEYIELLEDMDVLEDLDILDVLDAWES